KTCRGEKASSAKACRGGQAGSDCFCSQFGVRAVAHRCYPDCNAGNPDAIQSVLIFAGPENARPIKVGHFLWATAIRRRGRYTKPISYK
ncbi:hypothetical protein AB9X72_07760, partial [Pseudomonas sp. Env-2]